MGGCLEVVDAIEGPIMFAVSVVPIDSDPCARVAFHGAQVPHCADAAGVAGGVDSLAEFEVWG